MARTLELDTLKHPSASAANITLASSGLTTMPTVNIDGGAITGTTLGASDPSSVVATTLNSTGNATFGDAITDATTVTGTLAVAGATTLSGATTATSIAATTLTTSGAATFGNSADDATTVTGTLAVTRAATLNDNVTLGDSIYDAIFIKGTTTVGTTNGDQTINIASHDEDNGGLGLAGVLVKASAAELNVMDGGALAPAMTLTATDRIVVNDGGLMKQVLLSDLETFMESALDTTANITSVGTLTGLAIANGGNIGSAGDGDAMAIAASGAVTFSQTPIFTTGITVSGGTITGTLQTPAQPNLTTVGALVAGSLGTNFGNISIGSSTITTTGAVSTGALTATTIQTGQGATFATVTSSGAAVMSSTLSVAGATTLNGNVTLGNASGDTITVTGGLVLNSAITGSAILDSNAMSGTSATKLSSSASIKAYVDAQILTEDTLGELDDTNISSPASANILLYDGTNSWDNKVMSGDATINSAGALTIGTSKVTYAKIQNVSATNKILGRDTGGAGNIEEISPSAVLTMLGIEASADVTDATNVRGAGALMDDECNSLASVKALNQSVVSGATPTFTTTNFTDASNKRLMTDAQETILNSVESGATADQTKGDIDGLSITVVGALSTGGSITSGFGTINNGGSAITTTGTITGGTVIGGGTTVGSNAAGARTVSTSGPSGGSNGAIHYEY